MVNNKSFQNPASDDENAESSSEEFLVAGIGASAGGIQALKIFFENVPVDSGIAYVVILHLSPDHESQLASVLQTNSKIPVQRVTEQVRLAPNNVYVVQPNKSLTISDGNLDVSEVETVEERRAPIDIFFRTLAETRRERAVAVVLSGSGADGSMGLKRVKEQGGICFVQNPREAEFSEMPRNSIATELVDAVLNVKDIPQRIISYKESFGTIAIPAEPEGRPEDQQKALREIFTQLRIRTGHDFSNYKRPTVLRRIERRINVNNLPDLPSYADFLTKLPEETHALLKDLLISVTNFFRDKEAFAFLENVVIPKILEGKAKEDQIRVWVAGCATGEEAYSLAMLFTRQTNKTIDAPTIQIFATDIDDAAIAAAREGIYTIIDAADVPPEYLNSYFKKENNVYRVRREIREKILFANHNVLKDPPFSHLDLATCRNLLIYFNHTAQERVLETLHFALKPGSYLFIGSSESVDGAGDLFVPVSKQHHIYQSRQASPRLVLPPRGETKQLRLAANELFNKPAVIENKSKSNFDRISFGDLHLQLLEQYAPPSVIVNENYDILHMSERAGRFMQITGGEPSQNLLKMIRPELRIELQTTLFQAVQRQINVETKNLPIKIENNTELINIQVRPVLRESNDTARGFLLVIFEKVGESSEPQPIFTSDEPVARQLEDEIIRLKNQLNVSVEQFEVQTEELRSSNEELQALNEELRSSTEELETSKEELQSVNEELITVNQELKIKIEELSVSNNDFKNLLNSTDIGTVFLDRGMRVKMFTPSVREIFNLIEADLNRPLTDIKTVIDYEQLASDIQSVIETLRPTEREIITEAKKWFLMRVFPYRTEDERINGVIVAFIDITKRKQAENSLRGSERKLRLLIESATDYAIFSISETGTINSWNTGAEKIFGYHENEILGKKSDILFTPQDVANGEPERELAEARKTGRSEDERWHIRKDGSKFFASGVVTLLNDSPGGFVKIARDMTQKMLAEKAVKDKEILQRMVGAQEEERKRIARDLHDHLGQQLTALRLKLEAARKFCEDSNVSQQIDETLEIARSIDSDVDFLAWELRPTVLDDLGLITALENFLKEWSKMSKISSEFYTAGLKQTRFSPEIETNLYRICQEALNNIYKHASASSVNLILEKRGSLIVLIVEDDGIGFEFEDQNIRNKGIGLIGMQERASLLGGQIKIESAPEQGTTIFVRIPIKEGSK